MFELLALIAETKMFLTGYTITMATCSVKRILITHSTMIGQFFDTNILPFAVSTLPIIHFVCPPKFCTSIVFNFSWDDCMSQEKSKTMHTQNFGRQTKCIMGNVEKAN